MPTICPGHLEQTPKMLQNFLLYNTQFQAVGALNLSDRNTSDCIGFEASARTLIYS